MTHRYIQYDNGPGAHVGEKTTGVSIWAGDEPKEGEETILEECAGDRVGGALD